MVIDKLSNALKNKISLLVQLANIDGHFDIKERAFIYNVCLRKGVPLDMIGEIIEEVESFNLPDNLSYETAIDYLSESLLLMLVDGKVLPTEVRFCLDIGERLGFDKISIEKLIEEIRDLKSINYEQITKLVGMISFSKT